MWLLWVGTVVIVSYNFDRNVAILCLYFNIYTAQDDSKQLPELPLLFVTTHYDHREFIIFLFLLCILCRRIK